MSGGMLQELVLGQYLKHRKALHGQVNGTFLFSVSVVACFKQSFK